MCSDHGSKTAVRVVDDSRELSRQRPIGVCERRRETSMESAVGYRPSAVRKLPCRNIHQSITFPWNIVLLKRGMRARAAHICQGSSWPKCPTAHDVVHRLILRVPPTFCPPTFKERREYRKTLRVASRTDPERFVIDAASHRRVAYGPRGKTHTFVSFLQHRILAPYWPGRFCWGSVFP